MKSATGLKVLKVKCPACRKTMTKRKGEGNWFDCPDPCGTEVEVDKAGKLVCGKQERGPGGIPRYWDDNPDYD